MLKPTFLSDEYLVSDDGYVLSKRRKPLKPSKNKKGYLILNLRVNGKTIGVALHTVVARAYCDGYAPGLTVNHKNGNKEDCSAINLEWMSNYDNIQHSIHILGNNKKSVNNINAKEIFGYDMHGNLLYKFPSLMDASKFLEPTAPYKKLRCIQNNISRVANGKRKSYRSVIWKF